MWDEGLRRGSPGGAGGPRVFPEALGVALLPSPARGSCDLACLPRAPAAVVKGRGSGVARRPRQSHRPGAAGAPSPPLGAGGKPGVVL